MGCESIRDLLGRLHVYEADFLEAVRYALAKVGAFPSPESHHHGSRKYGVGAGTETLAAQCSTPRGIFTATVTRSLMAIQHSRTRGHRSILSDRYKVPPEWTERLQCQSQAVVSGILQGICR